MKLSSLAHLACATLLFSAIPASLAAQPSFTVSLGRAFNSFSEDSAATSRQSTAARIDLEHQAAKKRLRLFYLLDAGSFTTPGDWTYYLHNAGATWSFGPQDQNGKRSPAVFVGGVASWRANGTSWSAADYRGLALFANLQRHPTATSTFRAGYRFDVRDFPDFSQLDQREHDAFSSLLLNLPSRTTIVAEAHVGAKSYKGGLIVSGALAEPMSSGHPALGAQAGRGRGMGPSLRWTIPTTERTPGALSTQVSFLARVAQSLADQTGLALQYTHRSSFGGLPTAMVTTPALFFDDGIYDDPYASEADTVRATLKHVRPNGLELELQGAWMGKDYRGARALDLEGNPLATDELRGDRIWRTGASLSVPLLSGRTGPLGLSLDGDYWFTRHRSNDVFYNYRSHSVGAGVSVSY